MLFSIKIGFVWPLIINQRLETSPHICFLAIDHILGFLVRPFLGENLWVLAFGIIEYGRSWLFPTKWGLCGH
jgi:hypothetical protein